ncbi:MAG: hypothetical protein JWM68_1962 [Verrucomicrobiales bacterium]|nr:hypothetical protein [Verrucomicrobiales bacterium]
MSRRRGPSPRTVACRKCTAFIPVEVKFCPNCGSGQKSEAVPVVFVILLLCSSLLLMTSSYVTNKQVDGVMTSARFAVTPVQPAAIQPPPPKDLTKSAYAAAKGFIQQQYPNAQRISELNESPVGKNGEVFQVTMFVDSQDGGSPTRNVLQVNLELDRGSWKLKEIVQ